MYWEITTSLIVVVLFLWYRWRSNHFQTFQLLGIPGPKPNILFGNFLEICRKGTVQCHEEWIKKYGKIVGYFNGTIPVLMITDTELLKNIQIKDFHKFMDRPLIFGDSGQRSDRRNLHLVTLTGSKWKEIRSLVTPSFTTSKMKLMSPIINDSIDTLLENMEKKRKAGETLNMSEFYQRLTLDVISRTAFGIQTNVQKNPKDPLLRLCYLLFRAPYPYLFILLATSFSIMPMIARRIVLISIWWTNKRRSPLLELFGRCEAIINARKENPEQKRVDLLQNLIDAEIKENTKVDDKTLAAGEEAEKAETLDNEPAVSTGSKKVRNLTLDELVANTFLFLLAGYETTSNALSFITLMLVNHPDAQEKIRQEINELINKGEILDYGSIHELHYLDQVVTEVLRLYPPIYLFVNRETAEDTQYGNLHIPKGMAVQVPIYQLHRDPDYWPEPEKFLPERFSPENRNKNNPLAWQPFGAGPRNCVGMRFAQMEAKLTIAKILHKYRLIPSKETDKFPFQLQMTPAIIRPKHGAPLKLEPCEETA